MSNMQAIAAHLGPNHKLALALWKTGIYEARMLASLVDLPEKVTAGQMEAWRGDFDNWAICDTVCFKLFDRAPYAWAKTREWCLTASEATAEHHRRAGFAMLASLAGHDRNATEAQFLEALPWIEAAATDERNFVKKAVLWALRRIATRGPALHEECRKLATHLGASTTSKSPDGSARRRCVKWKKPKTPASGPIGTILATRPPQCGRSWATPGRSQAQRSSRDSPR